MYNRARYERFTETTGDSLRSGALAGDLYAGAARRKTVRSGTAGLAGEKGQGNPFATRLRLCGGWGGRRRHDTREPRSVLPLANRPANAARRLEARLER